MRARIHTYFVHSVFSFSFPRFFASTTVYIIINMFFVLFFRLQNGWIIKKKATETSRIKRMLM